MMEIGSRLKSSEIGDIYEYSYLNGQSQENRAIEDGLGIHMQLGIEVSIFPLPLPHVHAYYSQRNCMRKVNPNFSIPFIKDVNNV